MRAISGFLEEIDAESLIHQEKYEEALPLLLKILSSPECLHRDLVLSQTALCYMKLENYEEARKYLEQSLDLNSEDVSVLYNLGYCYYQLEEYAPALRLFSIVDEKEPAQDVSYHRGLCLVHLGRHSEARQVFSALLKPPLSPGLIYNAGLSLIRTGKAALARDLFVEYLGRAGNDIDATFGLGIAYNSLGEHRQAIECLERVISWDPKRYESAYVSLGMSYYQIGSKRKAAQYLKRGLEQNPSNPEAWYYLGIVQESESENLAAMESYKRAGNLHHAFSDAWERMGLLQVRMGLLDEARLSLKKAYKLSRKENLAFQLGLLSMTSKLYGDAVDYFGKCVEMEKKNAILWENRAVCYYYLEDYALAANCGQRAILMKSLNEFIFYLTGNSFLKLGKIREAREYLELGLEKNPQDVPTLYTMGLLEGGLENYDEARQYLERALDIERTADVIYALALTQMKLSQPAEAAALLEEYQEHHRRDSGILYKLGMLFIELGFRDKAKKALEAALAVDPGHTRAKEFLASLQEEGLI